MSQTTEHESGESSDSLTQQEDPNLMMMRVFSQDPLTHPFRCIRCSKRFSTTQALGGHQNAHKKEREEELRLHIEQQQRFMPPPISTFLSPLPFVWVHTPALVNNPVMASHGSMVIHPLTDHPAGFHYGPTRTHDQVKVADAGNSRSYHPYRKPANKQPLMAEKQPYLGFEEGSCSKENDSASNSTDEKGGEKVEASVDVNTCTEEVDLTLKL